MAKNIYSNDPEVVNNKALQPPFELEKCQYCGKPFVYHGHIFNDGRIMWLHDIHDRCTCPQAQAIYDAEIEAAHKEIAIKEKQWQAEQEEYERQKKEEERRLQWQRYYEYLDSLGLSKRQRNHKFENFEVTPETQTAFTALQSYANNFTAILEKSTENPCNGIFLFGPVGVGKTHLTAALVRQVGCNRHSAYIMSMVGFLEASKRSFNNNVPQSSSRFAQHSPESILDKALKVQLLVIDDLGKEKPSAWSLTKLYEIINKRYEELLPTVITYNHTPEELEELFKAAVPNNDVQLQAIMDRILESSHVIAMHGESYRLRKYREQ